MTEKSDGLPELPEMWKRWAEESPGSSGTAGLTGALANPESVPLTDISMAWIAFITETGLTKVIADPAPGLEQPKVFATPSMMAHWLARRTGVPGWRVTLEGCNFSLRPPDGYIITHGEDGSRNLAKFDASRYGIVISRTADAEEGS